MTTIQPFTGGICGNHHTKEFGATDYMTACIIPAKVLAMTAIDLLVGNAAKASEIQANFKPLLTKTEYLALLDKYSS